jgi:hypothetical protein
VRGPKGPLLPRIRLDQATNESETAKEDHSVNALHIEAKAFGDHGGPAESGREHD